MSTESYNPTKLSWVYDDYTLERYARDIKLCTACPLVQETAKGPTPGIGLKSDIVFVGRNPGADEDERTGRPFSGPSGRLLDELFLPACKLTRTEFFLTNLVLCHTVSDREPEIDYVRTCIDLHLYRLLDYLKPRLVVALGGLPTYVLTGASSIQQVHGSIFHSDRGFYIIPCFHPGAALYDPRRRAQVIADALVVRHFLEHQDAYPNREEAS